MNQVHKETLHQVENALPNRQGLDVEIFGMEGIPGDILEQHRNRIIQTFYQAQENRRIATGNPLPGQGTHPPRKKIKYETKEELLSRLAEWRAKKKAAQEAAASGAESAAASYVRTPTESSSGIAAAEDAQNGQYQQQQQPQQQGYEQPGYPGQPPYGYLSSGALPARPPGSLGGPPTGLPQRPEGQAWNTAAGGAAGDDIDQMIRNAEAGIKPPGRTGEGADEGEKKVSKKEKKGRLVYEDSDLSPEERMARMPRYAFNPEAAAA